MVRGEVLVVLETDKVSNELEAPVTGRLKILVPEGEEVPIGAVIATYRSRSDHGSAGFSRQVKILNKNPLHTPP